MKSREENFFYGHPQNRFWKVLANIFNEKIPLSKEEKIKILKNNKIALWDVIHSCVITGSSDSSIQDVVPNDLTEILNNSSVKKIFCNGSTSYKYFKKFQEKSLKKTAVLLPSTSPANAAYSLEKLISIWSENIKN